MSIVRVPVRIEYAQAGGPGYNVWHFRTADDDPGTWQLGDALDALEAFYTSLRALYPTTTRIYIGEGMVKDPLGSPEYVDDDSRVLTGSTVGGVNSTLLAIVVSWRTTSATRSGRGRTFLGPLSANTNQGDGTPLDANVTGVRTAAQTLVNASTGPGGWSVGVLSTKQGVFRDITGSTVRDRFSFLSSRRD